MGEGDDIDARPTEHRPHGNGIAICWSRKVRYFYMVITVMGTVAEHI